MTKIIFFLIGVALKLIWFVGLGAFLLFAWGIELKPVDGYDPPPLSLYFALGAMSVGLIYGLFSLLDFSAYLARNADKIIYLFKSK